MKSKFFFLNILFAITHLGFVFSDFDMFNNSDVVKISEKEESGLSKFLDMFNEMSSSFKYIDYDRTQKLVVKIPGFSKEVSFDFGFAGSGSIIEPLQKVSIEQKDKMDVPGINIKNENFYSKLGKTFIKNEFYKWGVNKFSFFEWLKQDTLEPVQVFFIKLLLLIKKVAKNNDYKLFISETTRLMFRLSLCNGISQYETLSLFLPDGMRTLINEVSPRFLEILDKCWSVFISKDDEVMPLQGIVINENSLIDRYNKDFIDNKKERLYDLHHLIGYLKNCGMQQVPFEDFIEYGPYNPEKDFFAPQAKLFSVINTKQANLGIKEHQYFIQCNQDSSLFDVSDTIKSFFKIIKRALHRSFELQKSHGYQDNQAFEKEQNIKKELQAFFCLNAGKLSQDRVGSLIEQLQKQDFSQDIFADQVQKLKDEIDNLRQDCIELEKTKMQEQILNKCSKKIKELKDTIIGNNTKNISTSELLKSKINLIKEKQDQLEFLLKQNDSTNVINVKKQALQEIEDAIEEKRSLGETIPEEFYTCLKNLRSEIATIEVSIFQKIPLSYKLEQRKRFAQIYLDEIEVLKIEVKELKDSIDSIDDKTVRIVKELRMSSLLHGYDLRINELAMKAEDIIKENEQVEKLQDYKRVLNVVENTKEVISQEKLQEIQELEEHVGYILHDYKLYNFLGKFVEKYNILEELFGGIFKDKKILKSIINQVKEELNFVIKRSSHIKENLPVYSLLVEEFVPELLPLLS